MDGNQPYQALTAETTVVPLDIKGQTALGFVVHPRSNESYEIYSVHYLPKAPANRGSSLTLTANGAIRTDTETVRGPRVFSFGFQEGDPLGTYRIDVYVNDQLVESASIEVVDPAAE